MVKTRHHRLATCRNNGVPYNGEIFGIPNVIKLPEKRHSDFHQLFPDTHPVEIAKVLNDSYIDPHYVMVAIPRHKAREVEKLIKQIL